MKLVTVGKRVIQVASTGVGHQGLKGDTGLTGPQGARGFTGDIGLTGAVGIDGPRGLQGETGTQGIQGVKGDTGLTGNTGATGADSTVVGPKGDTGLTGPKGDTGNTGAQGIQGAAGAAGAAGSTGAQGSAGQGVPTGGTTGQVLAKASATNYDTSWATPSGGGGGATLPAAQGPAVTAYIPGIYYDSARNFYSTTTNDNLNGDCLTVQPFTASVTQRFDQITISLGSAIGGTLRLGIYATLPNGQPGALIVDSGAMPMSDGGVLIGTINVTLTGGVTYLLAANSSSYPLVQTIPAASLPNLGCQVPTATSPSYTGWLIVSAYGPLPNPAPTGPVYMGIFAVPLIRLRAAS